MANPKPEPRDQRLDQELIEFLNELRVALPGVQVLFGFLLVVPFNARWSETTDLQRDIYFVTLLLTAGSTAFLIAPSAHARLRFRQHEKDRVLSVGNRYALAGLALLAFAITGAVLLITDVLFSTPVAAVVGALTFAVVAGAWFLVPVSRVGGRAPGAG